MKKKKKKKKYLVGFHLVALFSEDSERGRVLKRSDDWGELNWEHWSKPRCDLGRRAEV